MRELEKRHGLSRRIAYRPNVKMTYYAGWALILFSLFFVVPTFANRDFYQFPLPVIGSFIGFGVIAYGFMIAGLVFLYRLAYKQYHVSADQIQIFFKDQEIGKIKYSDIDSVSFDKVPLLLGMFTLQLKDKSKCMFTMAIERSEYILDSIYAYNSDLFDVEKLKDYRLNAVIVDHSTYRLEKRARNRVRFFLKFIFYPVVLASAYYFVQIKLGHKYDFLTIFKGWIASVAAYFMLGVLIYLGYDVILSKEKREKLLANPNDLKEDLNREKAIDANTQLIYFILSPFVFLLLWSFCL